MSEKRFVSTGSSQLFYLPPGDAPKPGDALHLCSACGNGSRTAACETCGSKATTVVMVAVDAP